MLKYLLVLVLLIGGILIINAQTTAISHTENTNITPGKTALVYVVPIKGPIIDKVPYFIRAATADAKKEGAGLIIFEINTPGGAVSIGDEEYTMGIVKAIENAAPITTVAFVANAAISAGVLISISCDRIVMQPDGTIGAAEPIVGSGSEPSPHQAKYNSAFEAILKAKAQKKGYQANLIAAMVNRNLKVIQVRINDRDLDFLTEEEINQAKLEGKDVVDIKRIGKPDEPLTLTAFEAKEYGIASALVNQRSEIPALFGIKEFRFKEAIPTWSEYLVMWLTSPIVSGILILAGLIAAGMALKAPGMGLPEAIAILCFGLIFFGHYLVGMAEFTEILIFIAGVGLLAVEIFILPGFGVFGIGGIVLIFISLILAMQGFTIPDVKDAPWQLETLQKNFIVVGLSFSLAVIIFILFIRYVSSVPFFHHLVLSADEKTDAGFSSVKIDTPSFLGKKGIVFTALRPVGKITILDSAGKETSETIDAVTEGDFINKGETVVIINIDGSRIVVERS